MSLELRATVERGWVGVSGPPPALDVVRRIFSYPTETGPVFVGQTAPDMIALHRGSVRLLGAHAKQRGWGMTWCGAVCQGDPVTFTYSGEAREYQAEAASALVSQVAGHVRLPCGSGKTETALLALSRVGRRALVLVGTLDLAEQWAERIRARLGVEPALWHGKARGEEWRTAPIVVSTVQSAPLLALGEPLERDRFGVLIVDECHHVPAEQWQAAVALWGARYRWGLTATPIRTDDAGPAIGGIMGPLAYTAAETELQADGYLGQAEVRQVRLQFSRPWDSRASEQARQRAWIQLQRELESDPGRLAEVVTHATQAGLSHPTLVLVGRKKLARDLAMALEASGVWARGLTSETKDRAGILAALRARDNGVIVATQLADEGLDLPNLRRVILAWPVRAEGRTIQRLGRLLRPKPAGTPPAVLIDLVDDCPLLIGQAADRARTYRKVLRK